MNQEKNQELEKLIRVAENVSDAMHKDQDLAQGFILIANQGDTSTAAVVGTEMSLACALYTACKSSDELTKIVMTVATELMKGSFKKDSSNFLLMGSKGDA